MPALNGFLKVPQDFTIAVCTHAIQCFSISVLCHNHIDLVAMSDILSLSDFIVLCYHLHCHGLV